MNVRRKIDGALSSGRGIQLLWVSIIIVISFLLFWGLSILLFGADYFHWQDIIALFLDPGVFGSEIDNHDVFRLIITFFGVFLLAAVLISIVSNIFDNISDFYEKGEKRYNFKRHILILGSNDAILNGLLQKIGVEYNNVQIVVMTSRSVKELRDEVEANLDDIELVKRITFYYDRCDNNNSLAKANSIYAKAIYIIGENDEVNFDLINLHCLMELRKIFIKHTIWGRQEDKFCPVHILIKNRLTLKAISLNSSEAVTPVEWSRKDDKKPIRCIEEEKKERRILRENIININDCTAEIILNNVVSDISNNCEQENVVNIVVIGLSEIGESILTTVAYSFHFANQQHTVISVIEPDSKKINGFIAMYDILFKNVTKAIYKEGEEIITNETEQKTIDDFEWNFIESEATSPMALTYLKNLLKKGKVYTYICYDSIFQNLAIETCIKSLSRDIILFTKYIGCGLRVCSNSDQVNRFEINIKDSYDYIFKERLENGEALYKRYNYEKSWDKLDAYNKQQYIFESLTNRENWCNNKGVNMTLPEKVQLFVRYVMGMGEIFENTNIYMIQKCYASGSISGRTCSQEEASQFLDEQNRMSYFLKSDKEPSLLSKFLKKAVYDYPPEWLSIEFCNSLLEYVKRTNKLSNKSIRLLYEILQPPVSIYSHLLSDPDQDCSCEDNKSKKKDIKDNYVKSVITHLSNNNHPYASLMLALLLKDTDIEESNKLFIMATHNKESIRPRMGILDEYLNLFSLKYIETIYKRTGENYYLDWLVACRLPQDSTRFLLDDSVKIEKYAESLTGLRDEYLFFRLGTLYRPDDSLLIMWLMKAIYFAQHYQNSEVLRDAYLRLGDLGLRKYYEMAFDLDRNNDESRIKYGRCLYWGMGFKKDEKLALSIGYDPNEESKEFLEQQLEYQYQEEEYIERTQFDNHRESVFDAEYAEQYKTHKKKLKIDILTWQREFPEVAHPFDEGISYYELDTDYYPQSGHEYKIKKVITKNDEGGTIRQLLFDYNEI